MYGTEEYVLEKFKRSTAYTTKQYGREIQQKKFIAELASVNSQLVTANAQLLIALEEEKNVELKSVELESVGKDYEEQWKNYIRERQVVDYVYELEQRIKKLKEQERTLIKEIQKFIY